MNRGPSEDSNRIHYSVSACLSLLPKNLALFNFAGRAACVHKGGSFLHNSVFRVEGGLEGNIGKDQHYRDYLVDCLPLSWAVCCPSVPEPLISSNPWSEPNTL